MDKLLVTFPQVKINLDTHNLTFNALEEMAFEITRQIGRKVLETALQDMDQKLKEERPEGALENTGKREKFLMTRLGDIRYERTRYIDRQTGKSRYLLEEKLGLKENRRMSCLRMKIELFIASITTYRGAKENVELLLGVQRSHESIRQSVIKEADQIITHEAQSIRKTKYLEDKAPESLSEVAYLEADSAFIRAQRRHKTKKHSKSKRRKRRSLEIKLGIGYTGRINRYQEGARIAQALENKFVHADITSGPKFMEDLSLIAEKRLALSQTKAVIFGGDGARWIKTGIKDYFVNATYILCRFHLWRNLKRALPYRLEAQKTIKCLVQADRIDQALMYLKRMLQKPKDLKEKRELKTLYAYIRDNRHGINSLERIQDKAIKAKAQGTGAIESNVDKFIAHRMKKRGMSWSPKGALALLKVKEKIVNQEWNAWWTKDRSQAIDLKPNAWAELTSKNFWKEERGVTSLLEAEIPALQGRDQNKPWAKVLRELQEAKF